VSVILLKDFPYKFRNIHIGAELNRSIMIMLRIVFNSHKFNATDFQMAFSPRFVFTVLLVIVRISIADSDPYSLVLVGPGVVK
jgi:hypothetical protein